MATPNSDHASWQTDGDPLWDVFNVFELFLGRVPRSLAEGVAGRRGAAIDLALELILSPEFREAVIPPDADDGSRAESTVRLDRLLDPGSSAELMVWAGCALPILPETVAKGARARTWRRRLAVVLTDPLLRKLAAALPSDDEIRRLVSAPLSLKRGGYPEAPSERDRTSPEDRASASSEQRWIYPAMTPESDLSFESLEARSAFVSFRALQHDPIFHLDLPVTALATTNISLEIELVAPPASQSSIYIDSGAGFSEDERVLLPAPVDGLILASIPLPKGAQQLRFDPTEAPGRFWLGRIRLQAVDADPVGTEAKKEPESHRQAGRSPISGPKGVAARGLEPIRLALLLQRDLVEEPAEHFGWATWRSCGQDPIFEVVRPSGGFPSGWAMLDLEIEAPEGATPSFYVDEGGGYAEESRVFLPVPENGSTRVLVRFPEHIRAMRFDPLEAPGKFSLGEIRVQPISRFDAFRRISMLIAGRDGVGSEKLKRLTGLVQSGDWSEAERLMTAEAVTSKPSGSYGVWLKRYGELSTEEIADMEASIGAFKKRVKFSIVMPTYNSDEQWLERAIQSVQDQIYPEWELCIADDASTRPGVARLLKAAAAKDQRIRIVFRDTNGHIARATNTALDLVSGDYIVFMDHDDEISIDALYRFAHLVDGDPSIDFLYSDEDKIDIRGVRSDPFFKPDWSPEYLESCMYTAHLAAYRADIVRSIGGLRPEFNGAQDYDFTLRFTEHVRNAVHVPRMLYHWRMIPGSTAQSMDNKDYVVDAAVRALQERVERTGRRGTVTANAFKGCFDLRREVQGEPLVSIVIPTAGRNAKIMGETVDLLANCLNKLAEKSTYTNLEFIVVDNGDLRPETLQAISTIPIRFVTFTDPVFNVAKKMNMGAEVAMGEFVLFLNDDIEVIAPDWLERMISIAQNPGVGLVGAKLKYESGLLQHVGITFCESLPDHVRRLYPSDDAGYFYSTVAQRNYLAVTGACMLLRREVFLQVGKFDERLAINYNDIDLCLAVYAAGLRVVYCPYAELHHFESLSRERVVAEAEITLFLEKWRDLVQTDPFYSEYFESRPPNFELALT